MCPALPQLVPRLPHLVPSMFAWHSQPTRNQQFTYTRLCTYIVDLTFSCRVRAIQEGLPFSSLLPPNKRILLADNLAEIRLQHSGGSGAGSSSDDLPDIVFDLDKCKQTLTNVASTLVTHGHFYSTVAQRGNVAKEHFLFQAGSCRFVLHLPEINKMCS